MIDFDAATALLADVARPLEREPVAVGEAAGRLLAEPVVAAVDSPPADSSAMDGYAIRSADCGARPVELDMAGESFAGSGFDGLVAPGQCVRIFTGAPLPAGTDRVVIQEDVRREAATAIFEKPLGAPLHVRRRGSDFSAGETLLPAGRRLDPRALVAAAAADVAQVVAWKKPRVAIVSTGDELAAPAGART